MNKYHNRRTPYGDAIYDSAAEADYARHLDLLKAAGQIHDWGRGYRIELLSAVALGAGRATRTTWKPDFFVMKTPTIVAYFIDVKGVQTAVFRLKMRMLKAKFPTVRVLLVETSGKETWL